MGFWDSVKDVGGDIGRGAVAWSTGGLSEIHRSNETASEKNQANYNQFQNAQQEAIQQGLAQGQQSAESMYGIQLGDLGTKVRSVIDEREAAMQGKSAESEKAARTASTAVGGARARAASQGRRLSAGEEAEIQMKGDLASQQLQQQYKRQATQDYQDILSNIASNSQAIKMGYASLNVSPMQAPLPEKGGLGSVMQGLPVVGGLF